MFLITVGQRDFTNSGCQELDECRGADSEDVLYRLYEDYQNSKSCWPTTPCGDVADEGSGKEAFD